MILALVLLAQGIAGYGSIQLPPPPQQITAGHRDFVSVKDFGAKGDGFTDDTVAIQAAATAAAGHTLLFPSATYNLNTRISVPSNTRLIADGVVVLNQITPGALVFYGSGVSNIEIRGFTMTGTLNATQPLTGASNNCGAICFETSGSNIVVEKNSINGFFNGITGTNLTGLVVRDNEIQHWRLYAVLASLTSDFNVTSNRIHDNDMSAVTAAWSSVTTYALGDTVTSGGLLYMSEQNGNLNHTPPSPNSDAFWLQVATYGVMATGNHLGVDQTRNSITENKIYNNQAWDGMMSHDCDGLTIANNDIRNVRNGIDLSTTATAGRFDEKIVIIGNYIEDTLIDVWTGVNARNCGIFLTGGVVASEVKNTSIVGNVINGFNRFNSGASATGGICVSTTESTVIAGNQITNTQNFAGNPAGGIIASGQGNGLVITGNSIDVVAGLAPIRLNFLTADRVTVTGNSLRDGDGTGIALNVASSSAITSLVAKGNVYNATTPYAISGTVTTQRTDFSAGTITLVAGSGTTTVVVGSKCVCTDSTANASVRCAVAATTLTATGTGTDVITYECF